MRIILDTDKCDGLGMCEAAAPDVFEVGTDGIVVILDDTPSENQREDVVEAIESCPVLALRLT
ncbi:ferredoxin [Gordonia sp. NB41Y]|uniref:ferredoxin n=1 Tax=Gordonia sp. NB41Y TaxID=875808 RepID=UPI0006B1D1AF|nr:ferredoxin [Gordonia sp. NB41Y]KOY48961.1 ferredoxin [Gordonia sp. NB41Y]WLP89934.1 ferredoxin [Gordonia sp. NB41Y]